MCLLTCKIVPREQLPLKVWEECLTLLGDAEGAQFHGYMTLITHMLENAEPNVKEKSNPTVLEESFVGDEITSLLSNELVQFVNR